MRTPSESISTTSNDVRRMGLCLHFHELSKKIKVFCKFDLLSHCSALVFIVAQLTFKKENNMF